MAFTTVGKTIPLNVPGGNAFIPTITFGGNSVGVVYTNQEGFLHYPDPGLIMFHGRIVLSNMGTSTGAVVFRLPAADVAGNTIPLPKLSTIHACEVINQTQTPVDQFSCLQTNASLSVQLFKRVGVTRSALVETDVGSTFNCYVSGFYFYTP